MKPKELNAALRKLWTKSQVPFDRDNLAAYTGLGERRLAALLTGLVKVGALGVESVDSEIHWTMKGPRPLDGAETLPRFERIEQMRAEAKAKVRSQALAKRTGESLEDISGTPTRSKPDEPDDDDDDGDVSILGAGLGLTGKAAKGALSLVSRGAGTLDRKGSGGKKSYLASAGLSFMGPLGWLYAGSFREAVPATMIFALVAWIIPNPILWPLLWLVLPVSSLAGLAYAFQYNRTGERRPLILKAPKKTDKSDSDDDD